jgi:hypothetical protein
VHIEKDDREAKVWIVPDLRLAHNDGFNARELRDILSLVAANRERIVSAWNEFFGKGDGGQV